MAVHLPSPMELIEIAPPPGASSVFLFCKQFNIPWNAFMVMSTPERKILYRAANLDDEDQELMELSLTLDSRKITIRRCVWEKTIQAGLQLACVETKKEDDHNGEGREVRRGTSNHSQEQPVARKSQFRDPLAPVDNPLFPNSRTSSGTPIGDLLCDSPNHDDGAMLSSTPVQGQTNLLDSDDDNDDDLTALRAKRLKEFVPQQGNLHSDPVSIVPTTNSMPPQTVDSPPPKVASADAPTASQPQQQQQRHSSFPPVGHDHHLVGIENQGNTCYLTAALVTLFHIPYFRACIFGVNVDQLKRKEVTRALQSLFAALQLRMPAITSVPLTTAFKWTQEEIARQHDVHEMILILLDCIEKQVILPADRSTSPSAPQPQPTSHPSVPTTTSDASAANANDAPAAMDESRSVSKSSEVSGGAPKVPLSPVKPVVNFINKLFRGQYAYLTKAEEHNYESKNEDPFLVVELPVENIATLEESLRQTCKAEHIEGFTIEKEGTAKKITCTVERSLKFAKLPPVLMIHPNRVVFCCRRMAQVTVNHRWAFPVYLDLAEFMAPPPSPAPANTNVQSDGVTSGGGGVHDDDQESGNNDHDDDDLESGDQPASNAKGEEGPLESYREGSLQVDDRSNLEKLSQYELRAVVVHRGTAMQGHYMTFVRLADCRWICVNDERTYHVPESEVMRMAFGGGAGSLEERAKLLVYLRQSTAARLLAEVAVPEAARAYAAEHERKVTIEYRLLDEAFAVALGNRKLDSTSSSGTVHRLQLKASGSTFGDLLSKLSEKHQVPPERLIVWRYGFAYIEYPQDSAVRITAHSFGSSGSLSHTSNIVVEIVPPEAQQHAATITSMYPTRVWLDGAIYYVGVTRSVQQAISIGAALEAKVGPKKRSSAAPDGGDGADTVASPSGGASADLASGEAAGDSDQSDDGSKCNDDFVPSKWNVFAFYGSGQSTLHLWDPRSAAVPINGVNLILAPDTVTTAKIRAVLDSRPIEITFLFILPWNVDEATELFSMSVDENTDYVQLQRVVHAKLLDIRDEMQDRLDPVVVLPEDLVERLPDSPSLLGFHSHHIDTCGPNRTLQTPLRKHTTIDNKVRDLLRSNAQTVVRRLYFEILPSCMEVVEGASSARDSWAITYQSFLVCTGFYRRAHTYVNLHTNTTVGDFAREAHRQARRDLPELDDIPVEQLRILGLDWHGKIYRAFEDHTERLIGAGVTSYVIDVMQPLPLIEVEDDDGDVEPPHHREATSSPTGDKSPPRGHRDVNTFDDETDRDKSNAAAPPTNPLIAVNAERHRRQTEAASRLQGFRRVDVYHISRYSGFDECIAPPTNVVLDFSHPELLTGNVILRNILETSLLHPDDEQYLLMANRAGIVLRGQYISSSYSLQRDQAITADVLAEVDGSIHAILVDHTDCLFATGSTSRGTTPSRTPSSKRPRAPEAAIRIADYDDDEESTANV